MLSKVTYLNIVRTDQLIGLAAWQIAEDIDLRSETAVISKAPNIYTLMFNKPLTLYSLVVTLCFFLPMAQQPLVGQGLFAIQASRSHLRRTTLGWNPLRK
jgi:hypothetical protein